MNNAHRILVADDSLTIRKLVESVLSEEGYTVLTAETGASCLKQAAAEKPHLILLDYVLPDMQGTEVCRSLINSPDTWEIPVLMMSSNGNAIRQLYQDLNNVVDYLTKPFAPSVLNAVVGHLLQKEVVSKPNEAEAAAPVSPLESVPREFMDQVSRLLKLMEGNSSNREVQATATENPSPSASETTKAAKPVKSRRAPKKVVTVPVADSIQRKFRLAIQKHLRPCLQQIPSWELVRGVEPAENFFLARLLSKDVLSDLSSDLLRATGNPGDGSGALRCPVSLLPLDAVLNHLHASRATGELRIEMAEETVFGCFENGEAVFLSTNHPRNYCAGAACDFQSAPHTVISEAVRLQEEKSLPFFISLQEHAHLPAETSLPELLSVQGERCLARAFKSSEAITVFSPLMRVSAAVRAHKMVLPLNQLLLACYRTVDDWFTLEKMFVDMDAVIIPADDFKPRLEALRLLDVERAVASAVGNHRTIVQLAAETQLKPFDVCLVLYRFLQLGLVRQESRVDLAGGPGSSELSAVANPAGDTARLTEDAPASPAGEPAVEAPSAAPAEPAFSENSPADIEVPAPVLIPTAINSESESAPEEMTAQLLN